MKKKHGFPLVPFILAAAVIVGGSGYFFYTAKKQETARPKYVLAKVERGFISSLVSGTGQVTPQNQFDVKPKTTGTVLSLLAPAGREVKAGDILVELDARDAKKAIRDAHAALMSARLTLSKLTQPVDPFALLQAENAIIQAQEAKDKASDDLTSAKLALEKLTKPADDLAVLQAGNAVTQARESEGKAIDDLSKTREDAFNKISGAFIDMPTILTGINDIFIQSTIDRNQSNLDWYSNQLIKYRSDKITLYKNDVTLSYGVARDAYTVNFEHYKGTARSADASALDTLLKETESTVQRIVEAVKAGNTFLDYVGDALKEINVTVPTVLATHQSAIDTYTTKSNDHLLALSTARKTIDTGENAKKSSARSIREKEQSLRELQEGADHLDVQSQQLVVKSRQNALESTNRVITEKKEALLKLRKGTELIDIQSQQLAIQQKENALADANEKVEEYTVRAPVDGLIANMDIKIGDSVSPSAAIATLITSQRVAEISLNEVDTARVAIGQKATLEFDALPEVSISGSVADIDTIGTVSQGVVSYTATIRFDTQDSRIKPGMSVTANIITDSKSDVLLVPLSAIKSQNSSQYVETPSSTDRASLQVGDGTGVFLKSSPRRQTISTGIANDEVSEVTEGLAEGDLVISSIIQQQAKATSSQSPGAPAFRIPGMPGGGGGGRGGFR
ncbi:MAG: efflux RND transporter periplasmic adaptor subunit [Patescibacteria group bacterium]